jgi:predicted transcriptional regulator
MTVSEKMQEDFEEIIENLYNIERAPSQSKIMYYLLSTGKTMTVREIAAEIDLTKKATERAVAKLVDKKLVQRSTFREGTYTCDNNQILLALLMMVNQLREKIEE